jgi:hypothetical protein
VKEALIVLLSVLYLVSPVFADPNLYFDGDGDGVYDTSWEISGKGLVEIYLDDWDTSDFSSEQIVGVQMYFYYDNTKIQVNEAESFAHDTDHEGVFAPSFSGFERMNEGKIKLVVGTGGCLDIVDKILLWTLEIQPIVEGASDVYIQVDYPDDGFVGAGGTDCDETHEEDSGYGYAEITSSYIEPEPIPTLTEWGMLILVISIIGIGVKKLKVERR